MSEHVIRRITRSAQDIAVLKSVAERSFLGAFEGGIPDGDMQDYFDTAYSEETLMSEARDPDTDVFVIVEQGRVVGFLKVSFGASQTEAMGEEFAELQRIYLLPDAVGGGYGSALMAKAIELAKARGRSRLWLGVWEHNERALNFYRTKGFERIGEHWFTTGTSRQLDWILARDI